MKIRLSLLSLFVSLCSTDEVMIEGGGGSCSSSCWFLCSAP